MTTQVWKVTQVTWSHMFGSVSPIYFGRNLGSVPPSVLWLLMWPRVAGGGNTPQRRGNTKIQNTKLQWDKKEIQSCGRGLLLTQISSEINGGPISTYMFCMKAHNLIQSTKPPTLDNCAWNSFGQPSQSADFHRGFGFSFDCFQITQHFSVCQMHFHIYTLLKCTLSENFHWGFG